MNFLIKFKNLIKGKIVERINKFSVKVKIKNKTFLASINNTGRLLDYLQKDKDCLVIKRKANKTNYRLIAVKDRNSWALIDTDFQMKAFEIALKKNLIKFLKGAKIIKRNPKYKNSVFDYLIEFKNKKIFVELKSAVLRKGIFAMYPDCPTERGRRHIKEITELKDKGIIIFICALPYVRKFKPYKGGDPEIPKLLKIARENKVNIRALKFVFKNDKIYFDREIETMI
jgi:sugar fermentation stimulation protein A